MYENSNWTPRAVILFTGWFIRFKVGTRTRSRSNRDIRIPSTFSRKEVPVDQSEIATPANLKQQRHLDRISGEIGGNESITIDLLIGVNCLKALEPLETISSQGNGPYATRTALSWCVIGLIDMKDGKIISCNRIAVTEASSGGTPRHHFAIEVNAKRRNTKDAYETLHPRFVGPKSTKR